MERGMSYNQNIASATDYGVVKVGSGISVTNGIISAGAAGSNNYGFINSSTPQSNPVANAINIVTFDTLGPSNGVSIGGGGNSIVVSNAGTYTKIFDLITTKTSGGTATLSIWLRKNGVDVVGSTQELQLTNVLSIVFLSGNYTLSLAAGDNIQMCWSSPDITTGFSPIAAQVNPTRPTGYAAKVTVTRID
jgi:hypothetical protein